MKSLKKKDIVVEDKEEQDETDDDVVDEPTELLKGRPTVTKEQEVAMFKSLTHKSYQEAGKDLGFHYYFKSPVKIRGEVLKIVRRIKRAPELYGISKEVVEVVEEAAQSRSISLTPHTKSKLAIEEDSFRDRLDNMRNTTAEMIQKKLNKANKSSRSLEGISIRDLKDLLSMAIDKSRLLKGESTETIAKLSKIDTDNMSPDEALKVVMKAREALLDARK